MIGLLFVITFHIYYTAELFKKGRKVFYFINMLLNLFGMLNKLVPMNELLHRGNGTFVMLVTLLLFFVLAYNMVNKYNQVVKREIQETEKRY